MVDIFVEDDVSFVPGGCRVLQDTCSCLHTALASESSVVPIL